MVGRAKTQLHDVQPGDRIWLDSDLLGVVDRIDDSGQIMVQFQDEVAASPEMLHLPVEAIDRRADGSWELSEANRELLRSRRVVPLVEERLRVGRRAVQTGAVSVRKIVQEYEQTIDEPTITEEVRVRRVPVNQFVRATQPIREEGDEIIVPLYEEVLVVEKRLVLKEELRLTRQRSTRRQPQSFTLRSERAEVKRTPSPQDSPDT